eukprot:TRINITY_DN91_c0_g1_i1.p1 TRINITY_DN91_c0_g1~~TRINITY_DN91_c0_g1_i1.p1  ORF type:complete len:287 (+),score=53.29 TRINITY_DN91_c0_g1_i1:67-927(+)
MDKLAKGWFSELGTMWPGQAFSLEVEEVLYEGKTEFQDIVVFKSKNYGKVLALDGVIQLTERDEFAYQEMIVHIPLIAHPNPKKVLIIGGGDGGVVREVCKHPGVESIEMCEIDKGVPETSKKFLPTMSTHFGDPRLTLLIEDGCKYLATKTAEYDVIIVDSSDPVGPAEVLFQAPFYASMRNALKDGGIVCTQAECLWLHLDLISSLVNSSREMYNTVEYAFTTIPTYPCGQVGFVVCSLQDKSFTASVPSRTLPKGSTRYYNEKVHSAAFVLPEFARAKLAGEN